MDRYYDCCKSGACIYNLSGRDIPYNPAESDSVCEENVEDRLVCGSDKLFCGNTSAEYKDMYGRTGMFKRDQQFCSSYRYDDQHEGTTAMHMIAITFIATAAGIDIKPSTLAIAAFLSICTAMGTPAIPVAGTTMVYVVMTGLGMSSELCMIGYSLVLAMNYLPGMAVITLNVIGDAATNVIVSFKEKVLNKDVYYK